MRNFLYTLAVAAVLSATGGEALAQCNMPTASVLNVINDSVTLSWPAVTGATGYEYVVQLATLPQPTSGTPLSGTQVGVGNLPYAAHKAWIRSDCGGGNYSNWTSISFTIVCGNPATVTVANITQNTADITWSPVADVQTYEYVLNQFSTIPPGNGTPVSGFSYAASNLVEGTEYYMHLRTDCGGSNYSNWTTQKFVTKFSLGINEVSADNINVYPNPVTNMLHIAVPRGSANAKLSIINAMGSVIRRSPVTGTHTEVDLSGYAPGVYFLRYEDGNFLKMMRIVKQ